MMNLRRYLTFFLSCLYSYYNYTSYFFISNVDLIDLCFVDFGGSRYKRNFFNFKNR